MLLQYLPQQGDADQPLSRGSPCGRVPGNKPSPSCLVVHGEGLLSLQKGRGGEVGRREEGERGNEERIGKTKRGEQRGEKRDRGERE